MDSSVVSLVRSELIKTEVMIQDILNDSKVLDNFEKLVDIFTKCFRDGNKILLAGNGGSAAEAQHMAGEYVNRFRFDRPPLPAIALNTDTSVMTAISNDYSYDDIFSRQIKALGKQGDVFLAYSTSGRSTNVLNAMNEAHKNGLIVVAFTGMNYKEMSRYCDLIISLPSNDTPIIQHGHTMLGHLLVEIVELEIFGNK